MAMAMADSLAALKSCVYSVQLGLLEGISNDEQLQAAGKVLTQSEYADVVTERTIVNLCGYPLCKNSLPESLPRKGRYRISLREHKVYDLQETRLFCSSDCLVFSRTFAVSLAVDRDHSTKTIELGAAFQNLLLQNAGISSTVPLVMEKNVLPTVMENDEVKVMQKQLPLAMANNEKIALREQQQLDPGTFLLICEQNQVKVEDFSMAAPSNAIEGYVPRKEYQSPKPSSNAIVSVSSKRDMKSLGSDLSRKKQEVEKISSEKKLAPSSNARIVSKNEFTSCILMNEVKSNSCTVEDLGCICEPTGSCGPSRNNVSSCRVVDDKPVTHAAGQRRPKKQNRVSWVDHNDLKLVEEASSSSISGISEVFCGVRAQSNQDVFSSLRNGDVLVEDTSELLPKQEAGPGNVQGGDFRNDNLECAKALVAALTKAAEAVAHGEAEPDEAAARAGISILPKNEEIPFQSSDFFIKERKDLDTTHGDELENADPRDCWYSAPPKDFKAELSTFGTIWMALDEWISAASIAHLYGRDASDEDNFCSLNGKEYLRKVTIGNGVSAEIERTLSGCISRALPGLIEVLRFPIPVSTLEQSLGCLLRTMSLVNAIPPFSSNQWHVVVMLFLDALSVHRLPALRARFLSRRPQLQKVLNSSSITEAEYEVFRDLVLPMGMLPEFAARCGG